jgi:uncharacterized protein
MYLIDTNIFLEILLKQKNSDHCKDFLDKHIGALHISDFSLHSIGVILFKHKMESLFLKFIEDTLPKIHLVSLPKNQYKTMVKTRRQQKLDFDDAYQYNVCKHFGFQLVTMDQDFKKNKEIGVLFL